MYGSPHRPGWRRWWRAQLPFVANGTKAAYLDTIDGIVQHFRQFQNVNPASRQYGRIIDPYAGMEIQYATPCFVRPVPPRPAPPCPAGLLC